MSEMVPERQCRHRGYKDRMENGREKVEVGGSENEQELRNVESPWHPPV